MFVCDVSMYMYKCSANCVGAIIHIYIYIYVCVCVCVYVRVHVVCPVDERVYVQLLFMLTFVGGAQVFEKGSSVSVDSSDGKDAPLAGVVVLVSPQEVI